MIPGVGTVLGGAALVSSFFPGGGGNGGGGAMPPMPQGMTGIGSPVPFDPMMGKRSIFRDDPNIIEGLKPWAIPTRGLRQFFRAPKGFVIRRDSAGDAFGIPKFMAKKFLGYKEADKPPISVRDWNHLKGADRVIKKFREIEKRAMRIGNFGHRNKSPFEAAAQAAGKKAMAKALGKVAA